MPELEPLTALEKLVLKKEEELRRRAKEEEETARQLAPSKAQSSYIRPEKQKLLERSPARYFKFAKPAGAEPKSSNQGRRKKDKQQKIETLEDAGTRPEKRKLRLEEQTNHEITAIGNKLSGDIICQPSLGFDDQTLLKEQIRRESNSDAKPSIYSELKATKRKRLDGTNPPSNDLFVDGYVEDRRESKKQQPSKPNSILQNSATDEKTGFGSRAEKAIQGLSEDDKMTTTPNIPFGPGRKPPRSKGKPIYTHEEILDTSRRPSDWYANVRTAGKFHRGDLQTISYVKTIIKNCIEAHENGGDINKYTTELRVRLHEMEFYEFLSGILIKKSKVLEKEGLEKIFDGPHKVLFPWDVRSDAEALWHRWMGGDLETSLLRGIITTKRVLQSGSSRNSHKLDPEYPQKKSANVVGANGLLNGQWWPSRICVMRDGAHGEVEAGIHGQTGKGAYSVVLAAGGYNDKDSGEKIEYCGTESLDQVPTKGTLLLKEARVRRQPVRVFRAVSQSKYAPKKGIRYDGLYEITDWEILKPETAAYRFSLRRQPGQDPIRYQNAEIRPTAQELREEMKIRELLA